MVTCTGKDLIMKKYLMELSQAEMDQIVYALVLLKVDAMNCLEGEIGDRVSNSKQLSMAIELLNRCAEMECAKICGNWQFW